MKAKKVKESLFEFINPKTDKYKLEDTLPLGPNAIRIKEVKDILVDDGLKLDDVKIEVHGKFIYVQLFDDEDDISYEARKAIPLLNIDYGDGDIMWFKNGSRHREDGPAVILDDGTKYWVLNGNIFTEEQYNIIIKTL